MSTKPVENGDLSEEDSGDSDWDAVESTAADSDGSESIDSQSTDNDSDTDTDPEPEPAPAAPKVAAKKKEKKPTVSAPAASPAQSERSVPEPKKKGKAKRIAPIDAGSKAAKPKAEPKPVIVKYCAATENGILGRPMKNAREIGATPGAEEYPSVLAYRENMPTRYDQYAKVNIQTSRKPMVCRAFKTVSLKPPHKITTFVITSEPEDRAALAKLGVDLSNKDETVALASAALCQSKNQAVAAEKHMKAVSDQTKAAIGWTDGKSFAEQPPVMCPELADALIGKSKESKKTVLSKPKAAPACSAASHSTPAPQIIKVEDECPGEKRKRPADDVHESSAVPKKLAQQLQTIFGADISTISITMTVAPPKDMTQRTI